MEAGIKNKLPPTAMTDSNRDTIFDAAPVTEDFVFNERVVEVFDDMLDRSVPHYREVIHASSQLLAQYLNKGDTVYDLGCATGTTLLEFSRLLEDKKLHFIGLDNSRPMLAKARLKSELFSKQQSLSFFLEDITAFEHPDAGSIILNYTLQFIRPLQREAFIKRIFDNLRPGGILLLSEKVLSHDRKLNRRYIEIYHQFKKSQGYSELEIAHKREALENILIPFSITENLSMLQKCGFTSVETYFQWFNFASFIAVKPE